MLLYVRAIRERKIAENTDPSKEPLSEEMLHLMDVVQAVAKEHRMNRDPIGEVDELTLLEQ